MSVTELVKQASFEGTAFGWLNRQFTRPKPLPAGFNLTDQVAIVTGSNVGLGFEASRQLLQLGVSHLIMGVRSQAKGNTAAAQLSTEFPSATISVWILDMESYDSILAFAEQSKALPRIDIAILNAGLVNMSYKTVPSTNHENTLQVNYLSTALLALLLLPILRAKKIASARPPILSLVVSDAAYSAPIKTTGPVIQQLDNPKAFNQVYWYSISKLFLVLFVSKLAELVDPDDVLINMANPSMTKGTAIFYNTPWILQKLVEFIQFIFGRTLAVGASTYIYALTLGKESHGAFTSDWTIKALPKIYYTPEGKEVRERLWEETMEEFNFAGASKIVESLKSTTE